MQSQTDYTYTHTLSNLSNEQQKAAKWLFLPFWKIDGFEAAQNANLSQRSKYSIETNWQKSRHLLVHHFSSDLHLLATHEHDHFPREEKRIWRKKKGFAQTLVFFWIGAGACTVRYAKDECRLRVVRPYLSIRNSTLNCNAPVNTQTNRNLKPYEACSLFLFDRTPLAMIVCNSFERARTTAACWWLMHWCETILHCTQRVNRGKYTHTHVHKHAQRATERGIERECEIQRNCIIDLFVNYFVVIPCVECVIHNDSCRMTCVAE